MVCSSRNGCSRPRDARSISEVRALGPDRWDAARAHAVHGRPGPIRAPPHKAMETRLAGVTDGVLGPGARGRIMLGEASILFQEIATPPATRDRSSRPRSAAPSATASTAGSPRSSAPRCSPTSALPPTPGRPTASCRRSAWRPPRATTSRRRRSTSRCRMSRPWRLPESPRRSHRRRHPLRSCARRTSRRHPRIRRRCTTTTRCGWPRSSPARTRRRTAPERCTRASRAPILDKQLEDASHHTVVIGNNDHTSRTGREHIGTDPRAARRGSDAHAHRAPRGGCRPHHARPAEARRADHADARLRPRQDQRCIHERPPALLSHGPRERCHALGQDSDRLHRRRRTAR